MLVINLNIELWLSRDIELAWEPVIILKEEVTLSAWLYDVGPKQQALILVSFLDSKEGRFPWLDTDIYIQRHLSTEKSDW